MAKKTKPVSRFSAEIGQDVIGWDSPDLLGGIVGVDVEQEANSLRRVARP